MNGMRTVLLPEELCAQAEQKFAPRFGSLDEFLKSVMAELLRNEAAAMDEREQKIIEERLKGLGYI